MKLSKLKTGQTKASKTVGSITVRRMDFAFKNVPRYWAGNSPFLTHMLNALSATFPEGERFFVDSVRLFRDRIQDAQLKKEVSAFIGQEAMHSKEHASYNRYAMAQGIDLAAIETIIKQHTKAIRANLAPEWQLAITCALEHFTAIMAEALLTQPDMYQSLDPSIARLWLWHAIEENEHKGVAFDVYQEQVDNYWLRVYIMLNVTAVFFINQISFQSRLMYADGEFFKPVDWIKGLNRLWGRKGWFRSIIPTYFQYYRRDFHPWQHDTHALLEKWKQQLKLDEQAVPKAA